MSNDLFCLDCEGTSIGLFANDPVNPIHYYLQCEDCGNHSEIYSSITLAYDDWYGKYRQIIPYQHPNLAEHIYNIRGY